MKKIFVLMLALFAVSVSSSAQDKVLYKETIRCLNVELDGSETLRVVGFGRNRDDAREQAMKNAVYVVIFQGIKDGNRGCNMKPIVEEVNAREKYAEYFDIFFMDNGEYRKYVSLKDTKYRSKNKTKTKLGTGYEMTIRVQRSQLKARLKNDNIIL